MLQELQSFGLSEKEAKVYLASLEVGRATVDQLAKHAGVKRSTTYVQIESLMKKGLMSTYQENKKTYFSPESPEYLKRIFELERQKFDLKEKDLDNMLPDLTKMFESAGERPVVRFFEGKEGITAMREDTLMLSRGEEIHIIYSYDALKNIYTSAELLEYTNKRVAKGIKVHSLYTRKEGNLAPDDITPLTVRKFISHEHMPLTSDFLVYGNKLTILALRGHVFGIEVESKEIADSFRILFSLLWGVGREDK